jgi:hypothetical protein
MELHPYGMWRGAVRNGQNPIAGVPACQRETWERRTVTLNAPGPGPELTSLTSQE